MSKNFELLLQAGAVGEYFDDLEMPRSDKPPRPTEARYRFPRNEEVHQLVRRVFLESHHSGVRSLMISSVPGTIRSAGACVQIGKTLASLVDAKVCIVDANIARPSLHRIFGDDNLAGLCDALFQSRSAAALARQIDNSNLHFLPAGTVTAHPRAAEVDFSARFDELKQEFDYLVVAAPAADGGKNLSAIGGACDGALLVVASGGVPLNVMLRVRTQLEAANVPLLGVVLNKPAADQVNASSDGH